MDRKSMKVVLMAGLSALCGCAGLTREVRPAQVEQLDEQGASAPALVAEAGSVLRFVNGDGRPHQIYSNDCGELSSTVLKPGDTFVATIGAGPKLCHFQDLLAPLSTGYSATVEVQAAELPWEAPN